MFTSGSSADPKAVVHTFGNHYYSALGANEHIELQSEDRWLLSLPLHHVGGLSIFFRVLLAGATIVIPDKQESISDAVSRYGVTHLSVVPTQIFRLLEQNSGKDLTSLKAILVGGAPISDSLLQRAVEKGWPIYTTYGLTEMASQVATSSKAKEVSLDEGAKVLEHREIKINDDGEILVRGKTLFKGYVQGEKIKAPFDAQGWFATGDLGALNKEGKLTVTGRKDNMFISGGENIAPAEIEKYLCQLEGVEAAKVMSEKDPEFGCRPIAFIKLKSGHKWEAGQIQEALEPYLPKFKIPKKFYDWSKKT